MHLLRFYSNNVQRELYSNSKLKIYRSTQKVLNASATGAKAPTEAKIKTKNAAQKKFSSTIQFKSSASINIESTQTSAKEYVENPVKIQMLSKNLHAQIFGEVSRASQETLAAVPQYMAELRRHGISIESVEQLADVKLKLPNLRGGNIEEHFRAIAQEQVAPYQKLILTLANCITRPARPKQWSYQAGWTVYDPGTGAARTIAYPEEDALVLDVEVCVTEGAAPILATALGANNWYSWVSPRLLQLTEHLALTRQQSRIKTYKLEDLISLGKRSPKLIVGHNVSYDRARIREQYLMEDTGVRFVDTMSLHVCVSGVTSYQRAMMKSKQEPAPEDAEWLSQSSLNSLAEVQRLYCKEDTPISKEPRNVFLTGSLEDVRQDFQALMSYCASDVEATHSVLRALYPLYTERFPHPVTLAGILEIGSAYLPVNTNWLRYIKESDLAFEDLSIEAKYHLARRADEACTLMKDEKYREDLWLWDEDWSVQDFKMKKTKTAATKNVTSTEIKLQKKLVNKKETAEEKEANRLQEKFEYLYELESFIPARRPLLPGYPAWYRKLCEKPPGPTSKTNSEWSPGPSELSTGMQIAPKLLSLCWEGYPLHYIREHGWGFLVPFRRPEELSKFELVDKKTGVPIEQLLKRCPVPEFLRDNATEAESYHALDALPAELDARLGRREFYKKKAKKDYTSGVYKGTGVWCNQLLEDCCYFIKLPHKNGNSYRVGNPLSKDFLNKFAENVLSSGDAEDSSAARVIEIARMMSYWRNNRDRIIGQLVVWLPADVLPENLADSSLEYGAICPQIVACGTLTRRAMEPTWLTASNSRIERIGSELRAMVQAPQNYRIVGADVDSQELWIASVLGDAYACGLHGATPLGWMTLSGTKSNGTDMHSITAKAVGISRDHAKVINYARIYGAGQTFAEGLLKQFNPTFSATEAKNKASKMFTITKGKRIFRIREEFKDQYEDKAYSSYEAYKIALACNRPVVEMFHKSIWQGGTESAMFNRLEEIAMSDTPVTPFLGCRLSRALETGNSSDGNRFLPTRVNWVVQSGAVDFLHLMLVSMRWLMGPHIRFCLSFHDELRYLVQDDMAYKAALAMHITNLLTRSFCASRIGLSDLPMSVAFFSSVEVDTVLRKESTMDCKTPSNPHGLKMGYGIPAGESLNIYDAIKKAGGNDLTKWDWIK